MTKVKVGIIGGTGLDDPEILENPDEKDVDTPYGKPSSPLTTGKIGDTDVIILARHGKSHSIYPTGVNYRANIYALKRAILFSLTSLLISQRTGRLPFLI